MTLKIQLSTKIIALNNLQRSQKEINSVWCQNGPMLIIRKHENTQCTSHKVYNDLQKMCHCTFFTDLINIQFS